MQRKLKFRAWDITNKEMKLDATKMFYFQDMLCKSSPRYPEMQELYILMQYTGLKDKNGKEIYEGDIVKIMDYYANLGIVEYNPPNFSIFDGDDGVTEFRTYDWDYFEVIGNIHENPNLLKETK